MTKDGSRYVDCVLCNTPIDIVILMNSSDNICNACRKGHGIAEFVINQTSQTKEIQNIEKYRAEARSNEHRIMVALERLADAQEKQTEIMTLWHDGISNIINAFKNETE